MTNKGWKIYKIDNICEVLSSKRIFAADYVKFGIPFYRSKEIIEKAFGENISNLLYIAEEKYNDIKSKYGVPKENDILISAVGERSGIPYLVRNEEFYFKDGNLIWIRNFDDRKIFSKYLCYWFKSKIGQFTLENLMIGSAQKALTIVGIKGIELNLPPLEVQNKIAKVLSALDNKIELNNAINNNLEQQIFTIFDNIFPNVRDGENTISNYFSPKRGKNLLSKNAILGDVPVIAGGLNPATYHNVANTNAPVITISASGANAGFVNLWHIPVWSSDSSYIDNTITSNIYFWYVMLKKRQQEIFDSQTGSAQPHIYPQHIEGMTVSDIDMNLVNDFNDNVTPLFINMGENIKENQKLIQLRDTLLPKLMSGEIDVSKVEIDDILTNQSADKLLFSEDK